MLTTARHIALVALSTLLLISLPSSAQVVDIPTRNFLIAFTRTIPSLSLVWVTPNYCDFIGVVCDADGGASVQLNKVITPGAEIEGTLPEIPNDVNGADVKVTDMSLSGLRKISGTLPSSWGSLARLRTLDLSWTGVQGQVPDSWAGMRSLYTIAIANAQLCMSLPSWDAERMPALKSIDLSGNNMRGALSVSFGTFSSREMIVKLEGNAFCGCFPSTWTEGVLKDAALGAHVQQLIATHMRSVLEMGSGHPPFTAAGRLLASPAVNPIHHIVEGDLAQLLLKASTTTFSTSAKADVEAELQRREQAEAAQRRVLGIPKRTWPTLAELVSKQRTMVTLPL